MNIPQRSQSLFTMILEGFHSEKRHDTIHFNDTGDVQDRHKKSPSSWMNGLRVALVWIRCSFEDLFQALCLLYSIVFLLTPADEMSDALP